VALARTRQCQAPGGADEQRRSHLFFELGDALRDDRRRDGELPRGGREAAEARNGQESVDVLQGVDVVLLSRKLIARFAAFSCNFTGDTVPQSPRVSHQYHGAPSRSEFACENRKQRVGEWP
jgi:hypothetical protein